MKRIVLLWIILGAAYVTIEILFRGFSHPSMFAVGGLCGVLIGAVNQKPEFYKLPVVCQSLIGAGIVVIVEFTAGCVFNLWLGWDVWDYSNLFGNILGQVSLPFALLWVLLMPFAIWMEDTLRWMLYAWDKLRNIPSPIPEIAPYTIRRVYGEFFTGR